MSNKAVRLRTISTGGYDASVNYQIGTVTDGTFSPDSDEVTVLYTEVRDTPLVINEFISLAYLAPWTIRAVEVPVSIPSISVTVDTVNAIVTQWAYNVSVDYIIVGPEIVPPTPPTPGFAVNIQRNNSEAIHLDKDLTNILTATAIMKEETSIIDPVLIIETDLATIARANYITIPQFGRSYFITNIRSITNDLVELTCHVDVLSSFASEIRQNTGIVHRQENNWNLYLNDGSLHAYQNPIITTHLFPNGFSGQSYVLVLAGFRDEGNTIGEGTGYNPDSMGAGNVNGKTTAGLINYANAQIGRPYWYGTFGNEATSTLLDSKRNQYPDNYPDPGVPPFVDQIGQRVHDCVGLIKGYRWSELPNGVPVYTAKEDVDVRGLYSQCVRYRGTVGPNMSAPLGAVLFYADMTHCGVYTMAGKVVEARGHLYGVQENFLTDRPNFTLWGVPDWMTINTPVPT